MAEIAFLIIAIALAAFLIALIPTLLRTRHVVKEVEETVAVLRTDINVTLHQTNEILAKANVLVEDVNEKVQTIDPLFVAVAELSESDWSSDVCSSDLSRCESKCSRSKCR